MLHNREGRNILSTKFYIVDHLNYCVKFKADTNALYKILLVSSKGDDEGDYKADGLLISSEP